VVFDGFFIFYSLILEVESGRRKEHWKHFPFTILRKPKKTMGLFVAAN
jgi:hypothetical protein